MEDQTLYIIAFYIKWVGNCLLAAPGKIFPASVTPSQNCTDKENGARMQ